MYGSERRSLDQLQNQSLRIMVGLLSHAQMSIYSNTSLADTELPESTLVTYESNFVLHYQCDIYVINRLNPQARVLGFHSRCDS
jgi:hypothetical protein